MSSPELLIHSSFTKTNNYYRQNGFTTTPFERNYINLRRQEKRVYPDAFLKSLPDVPHGHPLKKEWAIRKNSLQKLIAYLRRKSSVNAILELGCGNGWLSCRLAKALPAKVYAVDINETEILQGARAYQDADRLTFICGDVMTLELKPQALSIIVLAASIQYFENVNALLNKLMSLLADDGEIHILDSPFYETEVMALAAKKRSAEYFKRAGSSQMTSYYHHHSWRSLHPFPYKVLYNPSTSFNRIRRLISNESPMPWVKIIKQK